MRKYWLALPLLVTSSPALADCDAAFRDALLNVMVDKTKSYSYHELRQMLEQIKQESRNKGWSVSATYEKIGKSFGLDAGSTDVKAIYDTYIKQDSRIDVTQISLDRFARRGNVDVAEQYVECTKVEKGGGAFSTTLFPDESGVRGSFVVAVGNTQKFLSFDWDNKTQVECPTRPTYRRNARITDVISFVCRRKGNAPDTPLTVITLTTSAGLNNAYIPATPRQVAEPKGPRLCRSAGLTAEAVGQLYHAAIQVHKIIYEQIKWSYQPEANETFREGVQGLLGLGFVETDFNQTPKSVSLEITNGALRGDANTQSANQARADAANVIVRFAHSAVATIKSKCT